MNSNCPICFAPDGACKPNTGICDNLAFFSKITQKTLSAFHRAGVDASLTEEIDNLRAVMRGGTKPILVKATKAEDGLYVRVFSNGHSDRVEQEHIFSPLLLSEDSADFEIVTTALNRKMTPVSSLVYSKSKRSILTPKTKISSPSEAIMFLP
jgi:hypothetical protein